MRRLLILPTLMLFIGCGNQNKVKMSEKSKEKVGTVVLVMSKTKAEYSQNQIIQLSKDIDPMINEFDGYLGRKMAFSHQDSSLLVDVVYYTDVKAFEEASEKELQSETCQKFFATMEEENSTLIVSSPVINTVPKKGKAKVIELVLFDIKPGYSEKEVIKAGEAVNSFLEKSDGFINRKLSLSKEGKWMDIVYWTTLENAEKASEEVLKSEICQKYFGMIDETTMQFMHLNIVIDTER